MRKQARTAVGQQSPSNDYDKCRNGPDSIALAQFTQEKTIVSPSNRQVLGRLQAKENDSDAIDPIPSSLVTSSKNSNE